MSKKALVAMSGGVDSSVAALLMQQQGYEVTGVTMKLFANEDICVSRERSCCSLEDVEDARSVAQRLGIPYYVFNFTGRFQQDVIQRFVDAYVHGATPNPCIDCNRFLKFDQLMLRAKQLGFDYVVTGHYARIEKQGDRYLLKKAVDLTKDQSYVLYSMTQEQLAMTLFPLGEMTKEQVRKMAEQHGLVNADKPDSQDICFVPDGDYASFIEKYTGKRFEPGPFVDTSGRVLGQHKGIIRYTIGQRKGLGISSTEPLYVCQLKPETNQVVLGREKELYATQLEAREINLIPFDNLEQPIKVKAKIRYRQAEQPATVEQIGPDRLRITFDQPQRAITKGQSVVLYNGDYVVGGGIIDG